MDKRFRRVRLTERFAGENGMWKLFAFATLALTTWAQEAHPILALGSPAPNFELPGVDEPTNSSPTTPQVKSWLWCSPATIVLSRKYMSSVSHNLRPITRTAVLLWLQFNPMIQRPSPSTNWIPPTS